MKHAVLVLCLSALHVGVALGQPVAITSVTVIDVETGERHPARTVLIEGDRIAVVGPDVEVGVPEGATVVAGEGRFLIPGLWDMHAHLPDAPFDSLTVLPTYVALGVTGVREMWSDPPGVILDSVGGTTVLQALQYLRDLVAEGRAVGPRLVLTTAPLDGPYGPDGYLHVIRTPAEARAVVAEAAASGVDAVGLYRWLGPEGYAAAAEAARAHGLPVVGLAPISASLEEMAAAGHHVRDGLLEWEVACSAAGDSLRAELRAAAARDAEAATPPERSQSAIHLAARARLRETFDSERCAQVARGVALDGVWQTPRLVYGQALSSGWAQTEGAAPYLPATFREMGGARRAEVQRDSAGTYALQARLNRDLVRTLAEAGIGMLVGTESYVGSPGAWGFSVHDELAELVGAGLSPATALRAATLEPARALGRESDLGTVESGKLADLVLLDADPLVDITHTTRIRAVIANGRLYDREALDALLQRAGAVARDP